MSNRFHGTVEEVQGQSGKFKNIWDVLTQKRLYNSTLKSSCLLVLCKKSVVFGVLPFLYKIMGHIWPIFKYYGDF